jgi:hypothetical protein
MDPSINIYGPVAECSLRAFNQVVQKGSRFNDVLTLYCCCAAEGFPTMVDDLAAEPY